MDGRDNIKQGCSESDKVRGEVNGNERRENKMEDGEKKHGEGWGERVAKGKKKGRVEKEPERKARRERKENEIRGEMEQTF